MVNLFCLNSSIVLRDEKNIGYHIELEPVETEAEALAVAAPAPASRAV